VLHRLFQTALAAGGRVRAETSLGTGTGSVAIVAVQLAKKIFGSLRGREVLVVGAGETSELVVDALAREGVRGAVVANRSYDRAADLAARIEGRALHMAGLTEALATSDLVLSSTAAPHQVITTTTLAEAMPDGVRRPLLMIDLAIPRDIEPAVGEEPNVFLYNVDDLRQIVDDNLSQRKQAVPLAERIVDEMTAEFRSWYASQEAVPLIRSLREQSDRIRRDELDRLLSRLTDLTDEQRSHLEDFSRRLLNKWLHRPTARLRQGAEATGMEALVHAARILYGLDDDTDEPESSPLPVRSNDPPS
jgi:glutamyl-tRNA reductase